ncbi:MAG: GHKL domain-containing protein [Eubacterium sp.]|nr:GHKL domain-containing protein [Eubacterium sp.]MCM1304181.1 GHKL domain-containing protein [Butyrivibrio sp.]MCM1411750.1 GHKL domain-containing protein [Lachnospiraceae bacterium]
MMAWYQILSFFLTNCLRIFLGLYLVIALQQLTGNKKKASVISVGAAAFITVLSCFPIGQFYLTGIEVIVLILIANYLYAAELRMCLFFIFFYEEAVALWEFIISAGLGVLFRSDRFLNVKSHEHIAAVWIVRLFMLGIAFFITKSHQGKNKQLPRIITGIAIAGLLGVILLSVQNTITISDDQLTTFTIFSMLIPIAILFFNLNRQYEMVKTIMQLEKEKAALLEHDYQTLKNTYAANAKLFHDFQNHIDVVYHYLLKDSTTEAVRYIENLRSPTKGIAQTIWIGDEAVDYLINSKIAIAISQNIQVNTNIEFPRHTNIKSLDLVAILGNLLDNALEAVSNAEDNLQFINLTIRRINDMLVIKAENGCSAAPAVTDGSLQTSKTDKTLHGWGLQSVRTAAERYDGTIETEYNNHIFCAVVTLSFEAVKA